MFYVCLRYGRQNGRVIASAYNMIACNLPSRSRRRTSLRPNPLSDNAKVSQSTLGARLTLLLFDKVIIPFIACTKRLFINYVVVAQ